MQLSSLGLLTLVIRCYFMLLYSTYGYLLLIIFSYFRYYNSEGN